jgi:hypothetical protein
MKSVSGEKKEGRGQLESWDRPDKKLPVAYAFDITTDIVARPGVPRVAARSHSMGKITALTGESIAEGSYQLFASDGEILKVKNVGLGQWVILTVPRNRTVS